MFPFLEGMPVSRFCRRGIVSILLQYSFHLLGRFLPLSSLIPFNSAPNLKNKISCLRSTQLLTTCSLLLKLSTFKWNRGKRFGHGSRRRNGTSCKWLCRGEPHEATGRRLGRRLPVRCSFWPRLQQQQAALAVFLTDRFTSLSTVSRNDLYYILLIQALLI